MQDDVLERLMGAFFGGHGHGRSGDGPVPHVFVSIQGQGDEDIARGGHGFGTNINGMGSMPFGRRPGGPPGNLKDELVIQGHKEAEQHYEHHGNNSHQESPTHYHTPWPHAEDKVDPLQRMFDEAQEMMESMMRVFPSHRDDSRHSVPIDWHDSASSSKRGATFSSTSSSSSFQRLADGSTESKTTTRRHDGTIETVTTTCTPDNVCQSVRELLDSAGHLVACEEQLMDSHSKPVARLKDTLQNCSQWNPPPDNVSSPDNNAKSWWKLF
jgi:hypothetical protein